MDKNNRWISPLSNLCAMALIIWTLIVTLPRLLKPNMPLIQIVSIISLSLLEISQLIMLLPWGPWRKRLVVANYSILGIVSSFLRVLFPYVWSIAGLVFSSRSQLSPVLQGLGFLLQTVAQLIALWAVLTLRGSFSVLPEARKLVIYGPYRYVRHPIYLAYILIMLSRWIQVPSWFSFLGCVFLTLIFVISAGLEERELESLVGFAAYHEDVSRFIPFRRSHN